MNFIAQVTISIVIYFILRISIKRSSSLFIASVIAMLSYIALYLFAFNSITLLPTIHFIVTGLSLIILFIAYYEILILEKTVLKIKKGEFDESKTFSIERTYKLVFKILGVGLLFLSLALISGLSIQSVFTFNLLMKTSFTVVAWIIYLVTLIGIKFFNFSIKYTVRGLFVSMWAVVFAYIASPYLI
ncbi:MAG: ABC-type uncharacterized transport system permease subunit [Gammaproteobacteria bacterium]|jgi:ABC-type uncharacterized transport system permease subunit